MDKAAIFTGLAARNALRREAKLPLLDLHAEFEKAVQREKFQEVCERFGPTVYQQVISELQQRHGAEFNESRSVGARWLVTTMMNDRLRKMI